MRPRSLSRIMAGLALAGAMAAAHESRAAQYYLTVDVPTTLGGTVYLPNEILRLSGGVYTLELPLEGDGLGVAALLRAPEGAWFLTPDVTVVTDEVTVETRDLLLIDGDFIAFAIDGSAVGIPDYAAIDAALYDPVTDQIALSFDVPVLLGGVEYGRSDLVALGVGFSLLWDAEAAGVPLSANLIGAEVDSAGRLALTFDVPVTLGATTFLPGQVARWEAGAGFSLYASDPTWPPSSLIYSLALLPAAGEVPDGSAGSVPVTATPAVGGQLTLSWGASCSATDTDYAAYEGTLGAPFNTHVPVTCSTGGATSWTLTPSSGNRYYLVVPRNTVAEGSYGSSSALLPRPPSASACLPQEVDLTCP